MSFHNVFIFKELWWPYDTWMMYYGWWPFPTCRGCSMPFISRITPDCTLLASANMPCKVYRCFPSHCICLIFYQHIWDVRLQTLPQAQTQDKLLHVMDREWLDIFQDAICTVIDSLFRCVGLCIAINSGPTIYWANTVLALYYVYHFEISIAYYMLFSLCLPCFITFWLILRDVA